MHKTIIIRLLAFFIILVFFVQGCFQSENISGDPGVCKQNIARALKNQDTEAALEYYDYLVTLEGGEDEEQLYKIAKQVLLNIYNKKVNYGSGANFILWADNLYKRTGIPYVRENTGMKSFSDNLELSVELNSFYAGSILHCDDKTDTYLDGHLELLKNPVPTARGTAAAMISNMNSKKYLKNLKEVYETDDQYFVRYYALKGLILNDYENYKSLTEEAFNKSDMLGKVIIAGALCAHGDNSRELVLKVAIKQDNEVLKARALEGYIYNKSLTEKEEVIKLLNSNSLVLSLLAAKMVAISGSEDEVQNMRDEILSDYGSNTFSRAIGLMEIDDLTGINQVKKALLSRDYIKQTFAAQAVLNYYRRKNGCQ